MKKYFWLLILLSPFLIAGSIQQWHLRVVGQYNAAGGGDCWNDRCRKVEILVKETICSTGTLTNFPMLITPATLPTEMADSDDGDYASNKAQSDGGDILAYDNGNSDSKNGYQTQGTNPAGIDTNRLAIEIVQFTQGASPTVQIWVEVPTVNCDDQNKDRSIVLYYNTTGKSQPAEDAAYGENDVWDDSNFVMVYHMDDASGNAENAVSSSYDMSPTGDPTYSATGKVGNAITLDGSGDWFDGTSGVTDEPITYRAWGNPDDTDNEYMLLWIGDTATGTEWHFMRLKGDGGDIAGIRSYDGSTGRNAETSNTYTAAFHWVVGEFPDTTHRYCTLDNDVGNQGSDTNSINPSGIDTFAVGRERNEESPSNDFAGEVDEVRVSSVDESADWLTAEYNSINAPATYMVEQSPTDI